MRARRTFVGTLVAIGFVGLLSPISQGQEHSYAPADIEAGSGLYLGNCAGCHGQGGDAVNGAELDTGRFRRATSDEDLGNLIRQGIPGTAMPPHAISEAAALQIVAFLRSLAVAGIDDGTAEVVRVGDPARGQAVFENRGECLSCHSIDGRGSLVGPSLSGLGAQRSAQQFYQSLVDPNAEIRAGNRFYRVVRTDGMTLTGRLLNQDTHTVQILDTDQRLRSMLKAELREHGFMDSPMPSYEDELDAEELADLVGYLMSLR